MPASEVEHRDLVSDHRSASTAACVTASGLARSRTATIAKVGQCQRRGARRDAGINGLSAGPRSGAIGRRIEFCAGSFLRILRRNVLTDVPQRLLIARDRELELIRSILERANSSGGALVFRGEPGVGKSALLDAAADAAVSSGVRVLRAAGAEFEADVAFSGLNHVLSPVHGELDGLSEPHNVALSVALGLTSGERADRPVVLT